MKSNAPLNSLKVLVTRPEQQAQSLCKAILAAGGQAMAFPVTTIKPIPAQNWNTLSLTGYDIMIFVSQHAAFYFATGLHIALADTIKLIAIGTGTAAAMRRAGLIASIISPDPASSESLLTVPALHDVADKKIVIVRGQGGREILAHKLAQRGANIHYIEVYQRQIAKPSKIDIEQAKKTDCAIITSTYGLDNLCTLIKDHHLKNKWLIVASKRIKRYAETLGFSQVLVADGASNAAVMQQIKKLEAINGKN